METTKEALQAEVSRDKWLAALAAIRIGQAEPLSSIETEPLEALKDWITFELMDRDLKDQDQPELF